MSPLSGAQWRVLILIRFRVRLQLQKHVDIFLVAVRPPFETLPPGEAAADDDAGSEGSPASRHHALLQKVVENNACRDHQEQLAPHHSRLFFPSSDETLVDLGESRHDLVGVQGQRLAREHRHRLVFDVRLDPGEVLANGNFPFEELSGGLRSEDLKYDCWQ